MWYKAKAISTEEKIAAITRYRMEKKADRDHSEMEEKARAEALKNETPEEKQKAKEEKIARAKAAKEKAQADKLAAKKAKAEEKAKIAAMTPEEKKAYQAERKARIEKEFAEYQTKHAAAVKAKGEAYSKRYDLAGKIGRFFFNIGQLPLNQAYMNWWRKLEIAYPAFSKLLYQVFYFIVFSEGVTIWQYLVMLFLPYVFASLCSQPFVWPAVPLGIADSAGNALNWAIFNEPMRDINNNITLDPTKAVIGGGLGNFLAFEIAVFTAQCINFPLQRNITFKSHGNPWWQAMWYFIGWVAISIFVNAVWGICNPFLLYWGWPKGISDLLKTFITGGISMIIFFFIFRIIFPAGQAPANEQAPAEANKA
jgi:hypothetical protein